jgi:N-acetylmuramoyl-L-alanine amidase
MTPPEGSVHFVQQGESTASLAYESGLFWKTIWLHPRNQQLRQRRNQPNILYPGDEIFIPARESKSVSCATEKKHTFVRKGVPEKLNVRFLDLDGKPYAGAPYNLTIDGKVKAGNLDGDGWLRVYVPPNSRHGHVDIGQSGELASCDLDVGELDPISELSGVQARMRNLGLFHGAIDGQMGDELLQAARVFREKTGLPEGDEMDEGFRSKLQETHAI